MESCYPGRPSRPSFSGIDITKVVAPEFVKKFRVVFVVIVVFVVFPGLGVVATFRRNAYYQMVSSDLKPWE